MADSDLADCGPIPFMEAKMRQPDLETASTQGAFEPRANAQSKRWLYLTQIGEDTAACLSEPNSASKSRRTYTFGDYVVVQCATRSENTADNDQCVNEIASTLCLPGILPGVFFLLLFFWL